MLLVAALRRADRDRLGRARRRRHRQFLKHAYPTGINVSQPINQMPPTWQSKYPIYYAFAAVSSLSGLATWQVLATLAAAMLGLAAAGFFLVARDVFRRPGGRGAGRRWRWPRWIARRCTPSSTPTSTRPGASSRCRSRWCSGWWVVQPGLGRRSPPGDARCCWPVRARAGVRLPAGGADPGGAAGGVRVAASGGASCAPASPSSAPREPIPRPPPAQPAVADPAVPRCWRCRPSAWDRRWRGGQGPGPRPLAAGLGRGPARASSRSTTSCRCRARWSSCPRRSSLFGLAAYGLGRSAASLALGLGGLMAIGVLLAVYLRHRRTATTSTSSCWPSSARWSWSWPPSARPACAAGALALLALLVVATAGSAVAELAATGSQLPQATIQLANWARSLPRGASVRLDMWPPLTSCGPPTSSPRTRCARSSRCWTPTTPT